EGSPENCKDAVMRYSSILLTCGLVAGALTARADEPLSPRTRIGADIVQVQASQPIESAPASFEYSAAERRDPLLMLGDVFSFCGRRRIVVPGVLNTTRTTSVTTTQVVETQTGLINGPVTTTTTSSTSTSTTNLATALFRQAIQCNPYAGRAFFKISE